MKPGTIIKKHSEFFSSEDSDSEESMDDKEVKRTLNEKFKFNIGHIVNEKFQERLRPTDEFFREKEKVDWMEVYKKFFSKTMELNKLDLIEVEARINSALNKYDDKKNRIFNKDHSNSNNNLLFENKYKFCNENNFIPKVMNIYNVFDIKSKNVVNKRAESDFSSKNIRSYSHMVKNINKITSKKNQTSSNSTNTKLIGDEKEVEKKINTDLNVRSSLGVEYKNEISNFSNSKRQQNEDDIKNLRSSIKVKFKEENQEGEMIDYENNEKKPKKSKLNSKRNNNNIFLIFNYFKCVFYFRNFKINIQMVFT